MKTTKENQFGRVRTFNLAELLQVICDDSALYVTKLVDIGNGRDTVIKQAKSKYLGKDSKITEDEIVDLGDNVYLVESENNKGEWYTYNLLSGYCSCPVGITCAPCKHKAAVTRITGKAQFTQTPKNDPCQRAMYHYIAWGRTLEPHMYHNIGDSVSEPQVATYISEKLQKSPTILHESLFLDDPAIIAALPADEDNEDEDSSTEEEYNADLVRERFIAAIDSYKDQILNHHENNLQDPATNNAMMAFTKTLKKSLNCKPTTWQKQMHEFGKGTVATNRTKYGGAIAVNPPAVARRTFKVPGRGSAPMGRPNIQIVDRTQLVVTEEDDFIAKSDKSTKQTTKKAHNFAKSIRKNETLPKRHTKQ